MFLKRWWKFYQSLIFRIAQSICRLCLRVVCCMSHCMAHPPVAARSPFMALPICMAGAQDPALLPSWLDCWCTGSRPFIKRLSQEKLLSAGDCWALFELKPHGTAIFKISNQFDIKPHLAQRYLAQPGVLAVCACLRLITQQFLGKSQSCAPFTSHDFVNWL